MHTEIERAACGYDENLTLLQNYRAGDREAGERLVLINRPLVYAIAARFASRVSDSSDLIETGNIGLVKAMNTFDFSRGCCFSTYAVPLILGEMRRFLRDDGLIKVSREEKKLCARLNAERERRVGTGEDLSIGAIAAAVGVGAADAAAAMFAMSPIRSLDEQVFEDDDRATLGSILCDEEGERREFDRLALRMAIERLPAMQRRLILLRYFRDLSQAQTARILGVTQVKVSREEKKILQQLRNVLS